MLRYTPTGCNSIITLITFNSISYLLHDCMTYDSPDWNVCKFCSHTGHTQKDYPFYELAYAALEVLYLQLYKNTDHKQMVSLLNEQAYADLDMNCLQHYENTDHNQMASLLNELAYAA